MTPAETAPVKVYISYSRASTETARLATNLADSLRKDGVDCMIDRYVSSPDEGWPRWSERQIQETDKVLVVCSAAYHRAFLEEEPGTSIEVSFIKQLIYEVPYRQKFVPVIFTSSDAQWVPQFLRQFTIYDLSSPTGYDALLQRLTGNPPDGPPPLGERASPGIERAGIPQTAGPINEPGEETQSDIQRLPDLNSQAFTGYAWDTIQAARRLGKGRPSPDVCSVHRLTAAILLSGLSDHEGEYTGGWVLRQTKLAKESIIGQLADSYPMISQVGASLASLEKLMDSDSPVASMMTANLAETLALARRLATASQGEGASVPVSARHLLGAAVRRTARPALATFFNKFGLDVDEVRTRMIDELPQWGVADDPAVWRRLLDPVEVALPEHGLPVYAADSTEGPDLIGITREVEAMASLVSAWSVEPPLSIGLFGEWGSGKSFFMQKMKQRVKQIASTARQSPLGQKEFGYYRNIVQVEFNAWHYVEGNLWASLVEHIFTNLRLGGVGEQEEAHVDSEEQIKRRLDKLLGEMKEKTSEVEVKQKEAEAAEAKRTYAEDRAQELAAEADTARARARAADEERRKAEQRAVEKQREADALDGERVTLGIKDIVEEVAGSAEIRAEIMKDLQLVGITPERVATVQGMRDALKEASEATTVLGEGFTILAKDRRRWWLLAWVLAVPAVTLALVWTGAWLVGHKGSPWLQSLTGAISTVAALAGGGAGLWKRYAPKLRPLMDAARRLKEKRVLLEQRVETARQERAAQAAQHDEEARRKREEAATEAKVAEEKSAEAEKAREEAATANEKAGRAAAEARSAREEADKLRQEAEALRPERRIAAFIQDRAAATDYRQHLGVPALIRRDFEKLSRMFQTQREEESQGRDAQSNDLAVVNRIILYIDDLDRCPPHKVVEVLRAIHLLLAFPLFVVIVAVDARWMKRSLRERFSLMLTSPHDAADGPAVVKDEDVKLGRTATPDDYLEKIFQVPFWIRPLGKTACEQLVSALSQDAMSDEGQGAETKESAAVGRAGSSQHERAAAHATTPLPSSTGGPTTAAATPAATLVQSDGSRQAFAWSPVEPRPRTLQLTKAEREYMVDLAPVIGRSPRSVKRFINCYRLLKATLDADDLARATQDGTFRTTMLLLALMTGFPDIAPSLLADLRTAERAKPPLTWLDEAMKRLTLSSQPLHGLNDAVAGLASLSGVRTIRPLVQAADLVDRFSFSPVRTAQSS